MAAPSEHPFREALHVLLIEDNPGDARLFEEHLRDSSQDFRFEWEEDLETGLQRLDDAPPDVVILDLGLPDSEGPETVQAVATAAPAVPVVVLTGRTNRDVALQAQEAGAAEYLQKDELTPALAGRTLRWAVRQGRMEADLRQREAWLHLLTESVSAGMFRAGPTGRIRHANEALLEMLGIEDEETLIGRDLTTLSTVPTHQGQMLAEDGVEEVEIMLRRADGTELVGLLSAEVVYNADGEVLHYDGVIVDITERKEREQELRVRSEAMEQVQEAMLITEAGPVNEPGPRIIYVNSAFEEMTGYTEEEVLGETPRVLQGPETDRDVLDSLRAALEAGEPWHGETTNYRKGGTPFLVQWNVAPVRDEDGSIEYWVSVQRDVTEERAREETLRQQNHLLEQTQRLAGGWEADLSSEELSWSDEVYRIHEVEPGTEIEIGDGIEFYAPEARPKIREAFERCVEEGEPYDLELPLDTAKGHRRWVRTVGAPSETNDGEVVKVAGAFQDITDRKEAEEDLRKQEAQFRGLANSIPGVVFQAYARPGREYGFYLVSEHAETLLGISGHPDGFFERCMERAPEDERERLLELIDRTVDREAPLRFEAPFVKPSGETIWLLGTATPERREDELVYNGVILDITERKREEARRKQVIERVTDAIVEVDADWRFTLLNDQAEALYDMAEADLLGKDFWDVFESALGTRFEETYRRVMETREPDSLTEQFPQLDGWFDVYVYPNEDGGLAFYFEDVTERKERERRLDAVFNNTYQFTGLMETDGTLIEANDTALEFGGLDESDVLGTPIWDAYWFQRGPETEQQLRESVRRAAEGEFVRYEMTVQGAEDTRIIDFSIRPVTNEAGEVVLLVPEGRDITARKETEEALREERDLLDRILETSPVAIAVFNPDGQFIQASGRAEEVLGLKKDEVTDRTYNDPAWDITTPEGEPLPDVELPFARVMATGEPVRDVEHTIKWPDGRRRLLSVSGAPLRSPDGEMEGAVFHINDITERREAERQLRESERRFRKLFTEAPIGIARVGLDGRIIETNAAFRDTLGYDAADLRGRDFQSFTYEEDVDLSEDTLDELATEGGTSFTIEKRYRRADGTVFWARLTTSFLEHEGDTQIISMVQDIDDQKRYQENLRKAKEEAERMNRLKSAFLANMSHEIRTPLTSIIGFAEMIGEQVTDDAEGTIPQYARLIEKSGHRLLHTLDGVLNFSKLESGEMDLSPGRVDLATEVKNSAQQFEPQAREAGIDLRVETGNGPLWCRADAEGLRVVLRNLVSNAIKYTEHGGTAWVRTRAEDEWALLEVEDTGIGMDPDKTDELFEAFTQESEGLAREYEGTGLGLAVCRRAVDEMGGSIAVETRKGHGSCFTVRLPRADEAP